jgi:hypothetical protein
MLCAVFVNPLMAAILDKAVSRRIARSIDFMHYGSKAVATTLARYKLLGCILTGTILVDNCRLALILKILVQSNTVKKAETLHFAESAKNRELRQWQMERNGVQARNNAC